MMNETGTNTLFKTTVLYEDPDSAVRLLRILMPGDVYTYLAVGREKALLIDTGCGYGPFREYIEGLTSLSYEVVLTHGHVDHAGGASEFETVYMDPADLDVAADNTRKEVRLGYLEQSVRMNPGDPSSAQVTFDPALLVEPLSPDGYQALENGKRFDLNGISLTLLSIPGHTPGSMAVYFYLEEKPDAFLLTGDAINSMTLLSLEGSLTVSQYCASLLSFREAVREYLPVRMLYSHPHNFGGSEIIDEMIEVCEEITAGTSDDLEMPGRPGILAKSMVFGNGMHRTDGKSANLVYLKNRI